MIVRIARRLDDLLDPDLWQEAFRFNRTGEEGRALNAAIQLKLEEIKVLGHELQTLIGQARKANCEPHPSEEP